MPFFHLCLTFADISFDILCVTFDANAFPVIVYLDIRCSYYELRTIAASAHHTHTHVVEHRMDQKKNSIPCSLWAQAVEGANWMVHRTLWKNAFS